MTRRSWTAVIAGVVLVAGLGLWWWIPDSTPDHHASDPLRPNESGTALFLDGSGSEPVVAQVGADGHGAATRSGLKCQRVYGAAGTTVCLYETYRPPGFKAAVYDRRMSRVAAVRVDGTPSRARVSPSGALVAWTVFRTGDSYQPHGRFSTTTGIMDADGGRLHASLEDFAAYVDGKRYDAKDSNYWGVTFASDDNTFYVTLSSRGHTWLMRGDLRRERLTSVRTNVECPSLSPDGTRIAYKKKVSDDRDHPWRLHVLTLKGGKDVALAERHSVDDQAVWMGADTIAYARPINGKGPSVYTVPANGSGAPRLWRASASSVSPL
ncbi:MAG TPA: hypothetical protein VE172_14940 [Stackebrandtia sp.]|uniref:hypothetical protein n=1 Tax=Stackebrandtia sp. TaxID=2023065 RepID=UPI002D3DE7D7|nr:hypothetical protein [Stackebrandtia sp.]HZE40101.1 hypothetical protein [Stackebrandtia sp.]